MANNDAVNFIMISKTIGFSDRDIHLLLKSCFNVLVNDAQIAQIYRGGEHKYVNYKKDVRANKKSIPRRIIRYAKKNSLQIDIGGQTRSNHNTDLVSHAVSLVLRSLSLEISVLQDMVKMEFPEISLHELKEVLESMNISGYTFNGKVFSKVQSHEVSVGPSSLFIIGIGEVQVVRSEKTYFDRRRKLLAIRNGVDPMEYLVKILDRHNDYYSEEIQRFVNKVDSML